MRIYGRQKVSCGFEYECFLLMISCNPFNGLLRFLSQMVDYLDIFIWVCGLRVLVVCAGTDWFSQFGAIFGSPVLRCLCRLVRHVDLFQYVDFAQILVYRTISVCRFCSLRWTRVPDSVDRKYSVCRIRSVLWILVIGLVDRFGLVCRTRPWTSHRWVLSKVVGWIDIVNY